MPELVLTVPSMGCRHGARTVSAAVGDLDGVRTVIVDALHATVVVGGQMSSDAVHAALAAAGHPAVPPGSGGERQLGEHERGHTPSPSGRRGRPTATARRRDVREYRVPDPGIRCDRCVDAITTAVGEVVGVTRVEVDVANHTVLVAGTASFEAVRAAMDEAGFDLVDSVATAPVANVGRVRPQA